MPLGAAHTPGQIILAADINAIETAVNAKVDTTTASATYVPGFHVEKYGAAGDGTTDDTAAILAADAAAAVAGGTVYFTPGKTYRANGCLAFPTQGTVVYETGPGTAPTQRPRRWTTKGGGPTWDGYWTDVPDTSGSAILDLRYDGTDTLHPAKMDTRGAGRLEIDHLTIVSGGTDNFPIFQTTNTTVDIHHNAIIGNTGHTGSACTQDALVLGGASTGWGTGAADAGFQGYGTTIHDNYFSHVRRCVFGRTVANAVFVERNTVAWTCGGNSSAAAIDFAGYSGSKTNGVVIANNLIEVLGYVYGVRGTNFTENACLGNSFFDPGGSFITPYYFGVGSGFNVVLPNFSSGWPLVTEDSTIAGKTIVLGGTYNSPATYPNGMEISQNDKWLGGAEIAILRQTAMGYGGARAYKALQFGDPNGGNMLIALGVDPSAITGGSFGNHPGELIVPNTWNVDQVNAGGTDFIQNALSLVNGVLTAKMGDQAWTAMSSLGGSWVNYGGAYGPPAYRKDGDGYVHLRGAIKSGTLGATVITLPAGYRPAYKADMPTASYNGAYILGVVEIGADGTLIVASGNNQGIWLDGITFLAEA